MLKQVFNRSKGPTEQALEQAVRFYNQNFDEQSAVDVQHLVRILGAGSKISPLEGYSLYKDFRAVLKATPAADLRAPGGVKTDTERRVLNAIKTALSCDLAPVREYRNRKSCAKLEIKLERIQFEDECSKERLAQAQEKNAALQAAVDEVGLLKDELTSQARAEAAQIISDAQTQAESIQSKAEEHLSQAQAHELKASAAQVEADQIKFEAEELISQAEAIKAECERQLDRARDQTILDQYKKGADRVRLDVGGTEFSISRFDVARYDDFLSVLMSGRWNRDEIPKITGEQADEFKILLDFHKNTSPADGDLELALKAAQRFSCEALEQHTSQRLILKELARYAQELSEDIVVDFIRLKPRLYESTNETLAPIKAVCNDSMKTNFSDSRRLLQAQNAGSELIQHIQRMQSQLESLFELMCETYEHYSTIVGPLGNNRSYLESIARFEANYLEKIQLLANKMSIIGQRIGKLMVRTAPEK